MDSHALSGSNLSNRPLVLNENVSRHHNDTFVAQCGPRLTVPSEPGHHGEKKTRTEQSFGHGNNTVRNFIRIAKVGIAVAIIKSAPAGMDGEQYARRMCAQYQQTQLQYKESTSQLRREVLCLRQQLLQTQIPEQEPGGEQDKTRASDTAQCDETPTGNTLDEEVENVPDIFPTPPSSSNEQDKRQSIEARLCQHNAFLHSFINLRMFSKSGPCVDEEQWLTVAKATVLQNVNMLKDSITEPAGLFLSPSIQSHTAKTLVKLIKNGACQSYWNQAAEAIGNLINSTLLIIVSCQALNQHKHLRHLRQLVLEFARCVSLRHAIVKLLTHYVIDYTNHLRDVKSSTAKFTAWTFENMYHVIWCLEHVINEEAVESSGLLAGEGGGRLRDQLEDSLLHITEEFPLFAMYIWHVEGLLDNLKTKCK